MNTLHAHRYTPFSDPLAAIDEAVFLAETTGMAHRIESREGDLWVVPDNEQSMGMLIERIQAPNRRVWNEEP